MLKAEHSSEDQPNAGIGRISNFILIKSLGEAHLYPVYLAREENSTDAVVIKTMRLEDESFDNECQIFGLPEHDRIIKPVQMLKENTVEFQPDKLDYKALKECGPRNAVIMEYAENGDMFSYLLNGPFSESVAKYYFTQLLDAVEHLHENKFCHLDLKIENILLDKDFNIKLTDFGFSARTEENKLLQTRVGTTSCRPPEMWKFGPEYLGYDGAKVDAFQLGILLYILVTGIPPFKQASFNDLWYRPVINGNWDVFWSLKDKAAKMKKQWVQNFDPDFKTLIEGLLSLNSCSRPNIKAIRESEWFQKTPTATSEEVFNEMMARKIN